MAITSVSIIGSGNLATHLANALYCSGIEIRQIYSRNFLYASQLAGQVRANPISAIHELSPADLVIICVSDDAIVEVSESIKSTNSLIVHTSGSTSMKALQLHSNYGVLYPFQTFSKDVYLPFDKVSVFVEANTPANTLLIKELAEKITRKAMVLNSEQRMKLHLAAVFSSNFSNHMYAIAKDILAETGLPFEILYPLIEETTSKALKSGNPSQVQTGPAVRCNTKILDQHKEILANKPLWQKIYTFVSDSIMERVTDKKYGTF